MAEDNQATKKIQLTTKNPKKVEAGRRLAQYNRKKKEEMRAQKSEEHKSEVSQYYGIGVALAVGVIDIGYYLYQTMAKNVVPPQKP